ncbi:MAG: hypothetical protein DRN00_03965 [Thermoplasmata archaeon]|nr:MAG: hypothetical protein DRN03_00105 [Thermoplasmata archaeon]RLF38515.1 MAG: hypothetical protein DRN00_03965 [Thermoplasmata archaeon]
MRSNAYTRFCRRLMLRLVEKLQLEDISKKHMLEKANIKMTYKEYISTAIVTSLLSFITSLVISIMLYLMNPFPLSFLVAIILPILIPFFTSAYFIIKPTSMIKKREKEIDRLLPYVTNFVSTMASAGLSPAEIFKTLSRVDIYGEIKEESKKIAKEIYIMGVDMITALKHAIEVSPSRKFKEFLQGIVGTIQSGSDLNAYFENKVKEYMVDDLASRKKSLENLAVLAETFIITVIAFPLFLVIVISIMSFTSGGAGIPFSFLFVLSLIILPLAYVGYYVLMKGVWVEP